MRRRGPSCVGIVALASLLLSMPGLANAAEPKRGGTLRVAYGNRISHLDFHTATEKSVFNAIATVIKEQMGRIGVSANIKLVDKVSWTNTITKDGPWDMSVEDLLALLTVDSNAYLSVTNSSWNFSRHTDTKVDDYYARYASEMNAEKRQAIAKEIQGYMAHNLILEHRLRLTLLSGGPAVDERLHL